MNSNTKAAILVVVGMTMISSNDAILKLNSENFGIGQLLFIRGVMATLIFMLIIRLTGRPILSTAVINRWNLLRAGCECIGTYCFVTSLGLLTIATASTLVWTSPIMLTIASAVFLREKVTLSRWVAVFCGFAGVLLVTNPFGESFTPAMILPLVTAAVIVVRDLTTRRIDGEIHSLYVVLTTLILVAVTGGMTSVFDWRPEYHSHLGWLVVSAFLLSIGFFCQIKAVRMSELSFIAPFLFSGILVAVGWGYLIWGDIPSFTRAIGILMIIGSGLYVLTGQKTTRRKLRTMQPH